MRILCTEARHFGITSAPQSVNFCFLWLQGVPTDGTLNSRTNPKYHHPPVAGHQYSELLLNGMHDSSDGSATYTMPGYMGTAGSGSDGTTYSVTTANYHQPNCHCHLELQPPPHCKSPAMTSVQSAESGSSTESAGSSSTNPMNNSCNKDALWISQTDSTSRSGSREELVDRLKQPIAWIWSAVSLLLFVLCTVILTQTSWLVNSNTHESLGLLKQCKTNPTTLVDNNQVSASTVQCQFYSGISSLKLPSVSWKLSFIFYSIADTLLGLSTVLALGTSLLTMAKTRRHISFFAGYVQLFSGKFKSSNILLLWTSKSTTLWNSSHKIIFIMALKFFPL